MYVSDIIDSQLHNSEADVVDMVMGDAWINLINDRYLYFRRHL